MGEVYRARDSKLQRDVAIKVLPSSVASDPARLARFRREAQVLASLNHPHIGAIYGVEDSDRVALVLELVEGPTLAERIARGALSPDGRSIAFIADQKLKTVSLDGGTPAVLLDAIEGRGLSWGTDGNIYFNPRLGKGVSKVAASGGAATAVTAVGTEVQHRFPELLPDGSGLLFSALKNVSEEQVLVQSTRNGERRMLAAGFAPHYLPTGHLVYVQSGRLLAVRFDLAHLEVHGTPVVVLEGIEQTMWGTPLIAISRSGSMVYVPATGASHRNELVWVTPEGVESPIHVTGRIYHEPRLSPDGRTIVVGIRDTASDLWEYDIKRETWSRFTFDGVGDSPVWTPDGHKLTFNAGQAGPTDILWKPLDGSGPESGLLTSGDRLNVPFSWSPDGRTLAYVSIDPKTAQDIWTLTLDNERKPRPFLQTPFREGAPMFSPDGRWMTYVLGRVRAQ
jgi:Tol biopolymer transport system component